MAFLRKNFAQAVIGDYLHAEASLLTVLPGHTLPTEAGSFRMVIWDAETYSTPQTDPNYEIVTASYATAITYNITRAQESTTAVDHAAGQLVALHITAGLSEDDLNWVGSYEVDETLAANDTSLVVHGTNLVHVPSEINVMAYGATGDGTTDDTAAIQAAADAVAGTDSVLLIPSGTYKCDSALDFNDIRYIKCDGIISANHTGIGVTIGGIYLWQPNIQLRVIRFGGVATAGDIGVRLSGAYSGQIRIDYIANFDINFQCLPEGSEGSAIAYNQIYLGDMVFSTTCSVDINDVGVDRNTNENSFYGGRLGGLYGIRIGAIAGSPNNDKFYGPCCESASVAAVLVNAGSNLAFYDVRDEGTGKCQTATGVGNVIYTSYAETTLTEVAPTWGDSENVAVDRQESYRQRRTVADVSFDNAYATSTGLHLPGIVPLTNISDNTRISSADFAVINRGVVALSYYTAQGYGVFVKTDTVKDFVFRAKDQSINPASYGNLRIVCYDASNNILQGTSPWYVEHTAQIADNAPGYKYSATLASTATTVAIGFHTDVKKAFIGQTGYLTTGYSAGFVIEAVGKLGSDMRDILIDPDSQNCPVVVTGPRETPGHYVSATAPTQGWFSKGDQVRSTTSEGWTCTSRVDTAIKTEWATGVSSGDVDSTTGTLAGDIIGIEMDNGVVHWSTITTVNDGDTLTINNAVPASRSLPVDAPVWTMRFSTSDKVLFALTLPTPDDTMDDVRVSFPAAVTITKIRMQCQGATNVVGRLYKIDSDGVSNKTGIVNADWTITTTLSEITSFVVSAIPADYYLSWDTTSVSGTPTSCSIVVYGHNT